ncbi:MAG: type II secretion system protein GspD, partial [Planctomycetaceae bacterium]
DFTKIQPSDRIITQIIPLLNVDAVKLKADINSLIPSSADVTTNANSNTIIVTGTESTVRRIVEIVHGIDDRKTDAATVKVFQLQYANASNAARLITDIFKQDTSTSGGGGGMGGFGGRGGGGFVMPGMPGTDTATAGVKAAKVTASADDRTNTLVVSASAEVMKVIEGIVTELDSNPSAEQSVFVYHLKNADATNIEGVLNSIFGFSSSSSSGSTANRGTTNTNTSRGISGGGTSGGTTGSRTGGSGGTSGSSNRGLSGTTGTLGQRASGNTGTTGTRTTGARSGTSSSTSDLAGQVYVVADSATNSLLVTTASKNFERVRAIINDLDRAVPQVLIKVLIAEVTHDDSMNLGVEFSGMNLHASGNGFKVGTNYNLLRPDSSGFIFSLDEQYVTAAIHALANTTKLDVLSRPYILTSDNQQAQIMIGQSVPYVTSSFINSDTGSTTNTIQYQDIGIILDVTPHINPQGLVTLDVYPEISSISDSTIQTSPGINATVFNKRFAQSRVAIRDGQTIVIGGLMEDRLVKSVDKVPFLGDIPLLGVLFQHTVEKKTKTELLIFLTPHVALDPDQLKGMSEDEEAGTKAVQNAVEPGAYQEHLRGLERGAATQPAYGGTDADHVVEIPPDATTKPTTGESYDAKNRKELPYPNR